MDYFAGIDIGSSSIKIVIIDENKQIVGHLVCPTGSFPNKNAQEALEKLIQSLKLRNNDIKNYVSTGYGRKLFSLATKTVSEITANAIGALQVYNGNEKLSTIINIGGQDSKIIMLDHQGKVKNFVMNDKCAAGTGRFLEMAANYLELEVDQLEKMHSFNNSPVLNINTTCAVFAESEIISLIANGHSINEIVSAVHFSVAKKIYKLASRINLEPPIFFDGGTALNKGMVDAMKKVFQTNIFVPDLPQLTPAYGASLMALQNFTDEL